MPDGFINIIVESVEGSGDFTVDSSVGGEPIVADNQGHFDDEGVDQDIFTDYLITNRFEKDTMVVMLPVASPDGFNRDSVSFCQMASPTLRLIAEWTAARWNTQPLAPDPTPSDPNWILIDKTEMEPFAITYGTDGVTPYYRLSGVYIYGHKNPSERINENVFFGLRPDFKEPPNGRFMPSDKLQNDIVFPGSNGGGSSSPGFPGKG